MNQIIFEFIFTIVNIVLLLVFFYLIFLAIKALIKYLKSI